MKAKVSATTYDLSTTDAAVLALLAESEAHGFKVAAAFTPEGELGDIWTLQRTQIYRALEHLERSYLIMPVRSEAGDSGPSRTVYRITQEGQEWVETWLSSPVNKLRYGRSDLRLKLAFWLRSGRRPERLLEAQHKVFQAIFATLDAKLPLVEGVDRMSLLWRLEMARGSLLFVETLLSELPDDRLPDDR